MSNDYDDTMGVLCSAAVAAVCKPHEFGPMEVAAIAADEAELEKVNWCAQQLMADFEEIAQLELDTRDAFNQLRLAAEAGERAVQRGRLDADAVSFVDGAHQTVTETLTAFGEALNRAEHGAKELAEHIAAADDRVEATEAVKKSVTGRWELHDAAGRPVNVGDMLRSRRGAAQELVELEPPHKPDANGRVHVRDEGIKSGVASYYASVFDCTYVWVELPGGQA